MWKCLVYVSNMIFWCFFIDCYIFYGFKYWELFNEWCFVFVCGIVYCCCKKKKIIFCIVYLVLWFIYILYVWIGLRFFNFKYNYYKLGLVCVKIKFVWSCKYLDLKSCRWFCFYLMFKNICDWWSLGFFWNVFKKYYIYWSIF